MSNEGMRRAILAMKRVYEEKGVEYAVNSSKGALPPFKGQLLVRSDVNSGHQTFHAASSPA